ncbi:hypothetical protein K1T71_007508 [Dendrolimus kikuchii]|uniref:Uncharacterized protein n=1 Tax=Dendrolimus kikuchii TaxID=765133 RepID=A0ACC1D0N7_9NEOP|nr:hypothetical protein K1T71_007508 [Dendrolimus kikuchii]
MERDLKNKIAVVTGAATGIGYAIAENFLQKGAKLIIIDVNCIEGGKAVKLLNSKYDNRATFIKCDVTTDLNYAYDKIFSKYDYVDILVNNAGIANESSARKTMEINAVATIEWSVKFYEKMRVDKGGKGGTILNMASIYGFTIDAFMVYYKASKFAVFGFSKSLGHAYNYEVSGVRVIVLCPGLTNTNMRASVEPWAEHKDGLKKMMLNVEGQTPDEVGKAAVDIFENAASGTGYVIEAGKPLTEI